MSAGFGRARRTGGKRSLVYIPFFNTQKIRKMTRIAPMMPTLM